MAEYIERVKLIEKIANTPFGLNCTGESDDYKEGVLRGLVAKQNNVIDMIKDQPVADVAPVVRCEDCKYRTWFVPGYGCGNFESPFYKAVDEDVSIMTKPDDFCSYGEKREEKP